MTLGAEQLQCWAPSLPIFSLDAQEDPHLLKGRVYSLEATGTLERSRRQCVCNLLQTLTPQDQHLTLPSV